MFAQHILFEPKELEQHCLLSKVKGVLVLPSPFSLAQEGRLDMAVGLVVPETLGVLGTQYLRDVQVIVVNPSYLIISAVTLKEAVMEHTF